MPIYLINNARTHFKSAGDKGHIMQNKQSSSRKNRRVFAWLFLVSCLVLFVPDMLGQLIQSNSIQADFFTHKIETTLNRFQYSSPLYLEFNASVLMSLITLLSATISLLGFILSSNLFTWQKGNHANFCVVKESQKLELILADLQSELDQRRY